MWLWCNVIFFKSHDVLETSSIFLLRQAKNKSNPFRKEPKETVIYSPIGNSTRGKIRDILVFFN